MKKPGLVHIEVCYDDKPEPLNWQAVGQVVMDADPTKDIPTFIRLTFPDSRVVVSEVPKKG